MSSGSRSSSRAISLIVPTPPAAEIVPSAAPIAKQQRRSASRCAGVEIERNSRVTTKSSVPPLTRAWSFAISTTSTAWAVVEPAVLDGEALHQRGLVGADVEVGVRRPAHHVGEAGEEARLRRRQRLEPGDDPPGGRRLGGRVGQGSGGVADGQPRIGLLAIEAEEATEHEWISYQRSYAGWSGLTATNVPLPVAVTDAVRGDLGLDGRPVVGDVDDPGPQVDRPIGRRRAAHPDRVLEGDGRRRPIGAARPHQVPGRRPVRVAVEQRPEDPAVDDAGERLVLAAAAPSGRRGSPGSSALGRLPMWSPIGLAGPQPKQRPAGAYRSWRLGVGRRLIAASIAAQRIRQPTGAEGGIRTHTRLPSAVFETAASAIPPLRPERAIVADHAPGRPASRPARGHGTVPRGHGVWRRADARLAAPQNRRPEGPPDRGGPSLDDGRRRPRPAPRPHPARARPRRRPRCVQRPRRAATRTSCSR